jgi:cytochrome P450
MAVEQTTDVYYDGTDHEIARDPYPTFKRMRDEAPLYFNDRIGFYAVSRYDDVVSVLSDNERFLSRYGGTVDMILSGIEIPPGTLLFEDDPAHAIHRSLLSRMFTPKKVERLSQQITTYCVEILDRLDPKGFDFAADIGDVVPMQVIGLLLGIAPEDQQTVRDQLTADDPYDRDPQRVFNAGVMVDYVTWRKDHPSDDVVTELLNAEFDDEHGVRRTLELDELLMYVNVLAAAGSETTGRLITYLAKLLADHPDQRRELVDDPDLIPGAVEEALRYEAPAIEAARFVATDVEIHGQTVPAGSAIAALLGSANRDDRHYDDPDRFDIHRKASHLALSFGPHYCLGANLARIETRIVFTEVLKRFPAWEVDEDAAVFQVSPPLRSWVRLPVVIPS